MPTTLGSAARIGLGAALALSSGSAAAVAGGGGAAGPQQPADICRRGDRGGCSRESALLQRGLALSAALLPEETERGTVPVACTIRDFKEEHPDFYMPLEGPPGRSFGHRTGCLEDQLGPGRKPVYKEGGSCFDSKGSFAQWYEDVPGVNQRDTFMMEFQKLGFGAYVYNNSAFFPADGSGWGEEIFGHNYWFTMELHLNFVYRGGEHFSFEGDDDVWVFINGTLALDLGGIHTPLKGSVELDKLQLVPGAPATLDLFFAERQPFLSNFMVETQIQLEPTLAEGHCILWGDPHANVFDSVGLHDHPGPSVVNIFGHGDFWIVRSPRISIQGRYGATQWTVNGWSATRALAIGGQFLRDHTLIVEPMDGNILWDGEVVLEDFPSDWNVQDLVFARFHELPEPIDKAQTHRPIHGLDLDLPLGVRLTVNRWAKHLDLIITMRPQEGGQDGHCGNFNGNVTDDSAELIRARIDLRVSEQDVLFPRASDDTSDPAEVKLEDCASEVRAAAEAACRERGVGDNGSDTVLESFLEACIFDRCFGGSDFEEAAP